MTNYTVKFSTTVDLFVNVEAENEDEAILVAACDLTRPETEYYSRTAYATDIYENEAPAVAE